MSKLYTVLVPLLAVAAFAVAPGIAQAAEPYWTSDGKIIKEGQAENVATSASVAINALGSVIKCKLTDSETIENPNGGTAGVDQVTSFALTGCKAGPLICLPSEKLTIPAVGTWPSELIAGTPIKDEISGMELQIKCNATTIATFTGELTPTVSANSTLEFGAGSGELEDGPKHLSITGVDKMKGPSGDTKIGAEEVEHEPHWYSDGTRIVEGTVEPVATTASVSIKALGSVIKCKLTDNETIVNPVGGGAGTDKVTSFALTGCKASPLVCLPSEKLSIPAVGTWPSELIAGTPIEDEISGMELQIKCNATTIATFTGELTPTVSANSTLEFGAGSGELEDGLKHLSITGVDKMKGPAGDTKITAEDP